MLLLRRIFITSTPLVPILPALLLNKQAYHFSKSSSNRKYLKELHSKIVTDHRKVKADALVKMLHHAHFKSQQTQNGSIFTVTEIDDIVDNLSSSSFQLTHEDLTLLLETISSFPKYKHYSRGNQFMRLLVKRFNSMQLMALDNRYVFRFLNVLQKMGFPPLIISKYVNIFVNKYEEKKKNQNPITNSDYLKFFISILEMKFIPVQYVAKLYNDRIKNRKLSFPKDLCYLYYAYQTLEKSLQAKISYFSNKLRLHQLVFNPYSGMQEVASEQENGSKNASQQMEKKIKQMTQSQKDKMRASSQILIAEMKKQINVQKLKQQISKHYDFEKYPMQISTALLVKDIRQLQPVLQQFFKKHYQSMQAIQFISLLPSIPESQRAGFYQQYASVAWKNLPLFHKLALLKANAQLCHHAITKSQLISALADTQQISTQQFQYISSLISEYIKPDDQLEILRIIQAIADKERQGHQ